MKSFITPARLSLLSLSILAVGNPAFAQGFADDFSTDYVNPPVTFNANNSAPETTITVNDNGDLEVNLVHIDPTGGDKARYEVQTIGNPDSLSATGQFIARPETGNLRFELFGEFFNRTMDGGPEPGERTDNVELEIVLNLGPTAENSLASYCIKYRDSNGDSQPVLPSGEKCFGTDIAVEPNTDYTIAAGIDRDTQEIYITINDLEIREPSPYPFYQQSEDQDSYWARFRVRDGETSGRFVMSDLTADGESLPFNTLLEQRYRTGDFDNFADDSNRSKEVVNNQLRMTVSNDDPDGDSDAFLRLYDASTYIEADMRYSSESSVQHNTESFSGIRVAGVLYNENSDNPDDGQTGNVWTSVMLLEEAARVLSGEECAIRADNDDWSVTTDLGDGLDNNECPTFDLAVAYDQTYNASISLDQTAKTITFELGGERKVYNIESAVYFRDNTLRAQARMGRGATGTVVGYWDNLRNDPNARTSEELNGTVSDDDTESSGGGGSLSYLLMMLLILPLFRVANNNRASGNRTAL